MKHSLFFSCFFLFMLWEVQTSASENSINLRRLIRALHTYNPNGNNHRQPNDGRYAQAYPDNPNGNWSQRNNQWNNPDAGRYAPRYPDNPQGNRSQGNIQWSNQNNFPPPPNTNGYDSNPNGYQGGQYYQATNPREIGWRPEPPSGYNSDPNRHHSNPSGYDSTRPQWVNPGGNNNYQGNLNNPNYPSQTGGRPRNTSWSNSNGYTKPWNNTGQQGHGNQYNAPNDLMIYKRSVNYANSTNPKWHLDNGSRPELWNSSTSSHWNNSYNTNYSSHRFARSLRHGPRHQNISEYNIYPQLYNASQPAFNGTHWIIPVGHHYEWAIAHYDRERFHLRHGHHHGHHHVPPPPQYGPICNYPYPDKKPQEEPENKEGSQKRNETKTWDSETPGLEDFDEDVTPTPQ